MERKLRNTVYIGLTFIAHLSVSYLCIFKAIMHVTIVTPQNCVKMHADSICYNYSIHTIYVAS